MKFTAIQVDESGAPDPSTLPDYGVRVLGCTVRPTPLPTRVIYDAYRDAGFTDQQRNEFLSALLAGHGEHPTRVGKLLDAHPRTFTRSAMVEMYRVREEDRKPSQVINAWGWVSDAMPLTVEFDLIPTHWTPAPEFEP